jgi:hypothetical protein
MKFHHLAVVALLVPLATPAEGQVHLQGRVIDHVHEEPVGGATVVLQDERGRALARSLTDEAGHFVFVVGSNGPIRLRVDRMGFRRTVTPALNLDGYTTTVVEVRLDVAAVPLAPLEVVARSRSGVSPTLAGFERRRTSSAGWFLTREEIEHRKPHRVSDLLASAPGVSVQRRVVFMARGPTCPAQIFVDGFHVNRSTGPLPGRRGRTTTDLFPIDEVVQPTSVEGIEVYQGLSRMPPEFLTPQSACGVVAIWTRRGG